MLKPVSEMALPALVREFAAIRCAAARGEVSTSAQHDRLGTVVDELRRRGALD